MLYKLMEPSRGNIVKEFYTNLKDRKNLTCYVRGRYVLMEKGPFNSYSSSRKGKTAQSLRSSRRIPTSMRFPWSLLVVKESGRAHKRSPMPTSIVETSQS